MTRSEHGSHLAYHVYSLLLVFCRWIRSCLPRHHGGGPPDLVSSDRPSTARIAFLAAQQSENATRVVVWLIKGRAARWTMNSPFAPAAWAPALGVLGWWHLLNLLFNILTHSTTLQSTTAQQAHASYL